MTGICFKQVACVNESRAKTSCTLLTTSFFLPINLFPLDLEWLTDGQASIRNDFSPYFMIDIQGSNLTSSYLSTK